MKLLAHFAWALAAPALSVGVGMAAPIVTLSNYGGPPTTTFSVSGTGFAASAPVDVYFDVVDVCLTIATASGTISCTIKVPKNAQPQVHWISAVQRSPVVGAQTSFWVQTDWGQFHGRNAKHTGFNPYENTIDRSNVGNLDILWNAPVGAFGGNSTPVVAGARVFVAGLDGKLCSFYNQTGNGFAGWPKTLGGSVSFGSPVVGGNIVYVASRRPDNKLYAFNAVSGTAIAGFPVATGGIGFSSPTLFGGNVYLARGNGRIYAFNAATAAPVAGFPVVLGASTVTYPTVSAANGRIFEVANSTAYDTSLFAFNASTGAAIAGFPVALGFGIVESTVAIVSGQVFFGGDGGNLFGVRRYNGVALAGFPVATSGSVMSSPAVGDGRVIVGTNPAGKVHSYEASTGILQWTSPVLDGGISGSALLANGVVYINTPISLYALDEVSGTILWRASVPTANYASPVVADGIVLLVSTDGNLYAFSVNGDLPASRLQGRQRGVKPAISSLEPDYSLRVTMH